MKRVMFALFAALIALPAFAALQDRIVAKVNNEIVLQSEVEEAVDALAAQSEQSGKKADKTELRKKVIQGLVDQKIIITMASDEQISISPEAIADKTGEFVDNLRKRFPDEAAFEEALRREGMTYSDFRFKIDAQVRDSLIFSKVKQKKQQEFIAKAPVSDDEMKAYYDKNSAEFKVNDEMNLNQIYLSADETEGGAAQAAAEINRRLKSGESFDAVAASLKDKKGISINELGWVDTTEMDASIRRALSNPKKGKTAGPVETQGAYHFFKIVNYKEGKTAAFEDVKEKARIKIMEAKVEVMWDEWVKSIKESALIKYME